MADRISEDELKKEISDILKDANLAQTSTKKVRQKLEKIFEVDLSGKRDLIDKLVMNYVDSQESDAASEDDDDDEEEEERKPPKRAAAAPKKKATKKKKKEEDDNDSDYHESSGEDYTQLVARAMASVPKKGGKNNRVWLPKAAAAAVAAYNKSLSATKKKKKQASDDEDSDSGTEKKTKKAKKSSGKGKGKGSGYTRTYKLSPALSDLMGCEELPRHEVVKRIWAMIKEKNLYDPNNKRFAICDDGLYKVIGTKRFRAFGMMKYLKTHFLDD